MAWRAIATDGWPPKDGPEHYWVVDQDGDPFVAEFADNRREADGVGFVGFCNSGGSLGFEGVTHWHPIDKPAPPIVNQGESNGLDRSE